MAGDDAARQCCLEEMLERYRFTGERQLFDEVCATWESFSTNTVTGASDMQLWMRKGRDLFLMTGDVKYIDAMERRGGNRWKELPCVAELAVTRDVNHTVFVNLYPNGTIEMDGVVFEISSERPANGKVKVRTRSAIARNVRFRMPGVGNRPAKYVHRRILAGVKTFELP